MRIDRLEAAVMTSPHRFTEKISFVAQICFSYDGPTSANGYLRQAVCTQSCARDVLFRYRGKAVKIIIENLEDPSGLVGARRVFHADVGAEPGTRVLDATGWRVCPALYDADTLLPLHGNQFSEVDREVALAGGVARLNASIGWQRLADPLHATALLLMAEQSSMPRVRLLMAVMPDQDSEGFADWFSGFAQDVEHFGPHLLHACKLYGRDPHFARNLKAVWEAGWMPYVFTADPEPIAHQAARLNKPICFRHAASCADLDAMGGGGSGNALIWLASSPHFLLPVDEARRQSLVVRPPVPDAATRKALLARLDEINLIATDHVALGATTGPGLQTQHCFLPALLTLAEHLGCKPDRVLNKASTRPAALFGQDPNDWAVALVAPDVAHKLQIPGIDPDRDPFALDSFLPRVMAIVHGEKLWPTGQLRNAF